MLRTAYFLMLMFFVVSVAALAEENHEDHEALRATLAGATAAVNEQRFQDLSQYFHHDLRVTTINQELITKPEGLEPYFRSWIGPGQYVKSMKMTMEADDLTEFYGSGDSRFGVAHGTGVEEYDLADGRYLTLKTRWTATVVPTGDGSWKILTLHLGVNFYENQIVEQFQSAAKTYPPIAGVVGIVIGLMLGLLIARRKKA